MAKISMIGLDLAKNVFQIHGIDAAGKVVLRRAHMEKFFAQLPPTVVGMEACGGAHHWARVFQTLGHEVRIMPPAYVKGLTSSATRTTAMPKALAEVLLTLSDLRIVRLLDRADRTSADFREKLSNGPNSAVRERDAAQRVSGYPSICGCRWICWKG
jgi:transposase